MAGMVDTFLFLTLARTGDQLQGIKKGILEIADVIAVNKADDVGGSDREQEARSAARELAGALLRLVRGREWAPPVVTCSGLTDGRRRPVAAGPRAPRAPRRGRADRQAGPPAARLHWALVRDELDQRLRHSPGVRTIRDEVTAVLAGDLPATVAADRILAAYDERAGQRPGAPAPRESTCSAPRRRPGLVN